MQKLPILVLTLLVACAVMPSSTSRQRAQIVDKPLAVRDMDPDMVCLLLSPTGRGTAFPVRRDGDLVAFLTARHNVEDASDVVFSPGSLRMRVRALDIPAVRVVAHPSLDVALVLVPVEGLDTFALRKEPAAFGEEVIGTGWCLGDFLTVTSGRIGKGVHSAPIFFGMSGGPLLDQDLNVIGVSTQLFFSAVGDPRGGRHPLPIVNNYGAVSQIWPWLKDNGVVD